MVRIAGEYTILSPDWVSYKKVTQNGKFGYINQDKEIVIPIEWDGIYSIIRKIPCHSDCRYTTVDEKDDLFINHIAIAKKANKQYLINESGIIHITEQGVPVFEEEGFDDIGSLGDNLIPIKTDNKWGYVDTDGALIIYPEYSYSHVFQDGYCIIGNNGKYGVIDKSNSLIIDVIYDGIEYWESSAWIVSVHSKKGYISPDRTWNIEPQYDKIIPLNDNLIGVGKIKEPETYHVSHWTPDMVYGIIDKSEKIICNIEYEFISRFSNKRALIQKNNKYGYINDRGQIIIPLKYDKAVEFCNGTAIVGVNTHEWDDKDTFKYTIIDIMGNELCPCRFDHIEPTNVNSVFRIFEDNRVGLIDNHGHIIVDVRYNRIEDFSEGLAVVINTSTYDKWIYDDLNDFHVESTIDQCGYIDMDGKMVIPQIYSKASPFINGLASVETEDGDMYQLDKQGTILKQDKIKSNEYNDNLQENDIEDAFDGHPDAYWNID